MKEKSGFSQIMWLVVISLICILVTVAVAIFAGMYETTIFDITKLNFSNMIPVLIVGGFLSCVIVGVMVLLVSKTLFMKVKNHIIEFDEEEKRK